MQRSLNGLDLGVRYDLELIPTLPENRDESVRLADLDVARLVHDMAHEQVARKQRHLGQVSTRSASRPDIHPWEENLQTPGSYLITHLLLAIASSPEDVPLWAGGDVGCRSCLNVWQGFAPFGSVRFATKPIPYCAS